VEDKNMPMISALMATEMAAQLGKGPVTNELRQLAASIVEEIQENCIATSGSPTGTISSVLGTASLMGTSMANRHAKKLGLKETPEQLIKFCTGISDHVLTLGIVSYPSTPYTAGGTISGLTGPLMAASVQTQMQLPTVSTELTSICTAIAQHIITNAIVNATIIT
jgi:hypothetical protein